MTAPISNTTSAGASSAPLSTALAGGKLGKDEFIKLLVAQMTHQDPLSPTDGQQLAAQLAQFSSVEQLMNIGTKLDAQSASNNALLNTVTNSTTIGLLGKTVTVQSDQIVVGAGGTSTASTGVPAGGGHLTMRITDASGKTIRTENLGLVDGGDHTYSLKDVTKDLADGTYKVAFDFTAVGDTTMTALPPIIDAHIDGIRFGTTGAVLTSGTRTFPISGIVSVHTDN
jgi:flagellar basal-body rod modification protein FlgD